MKMSEYIDTLSLKIAEDFAYRLKPEILLKKHPLNFENFPIFEDLASLYDRKISFLTSKKESSISLSLEYDVGPSFFYRVVLDNNFCKDIANRAERYLSSLDFNIFYRENSAKNYIKAFELIHDTIRG